MFANESNAKVVTKEEMQAIIKTEKECRKTIVFTNGCFDLIHHVHIELLEQAKSRGDVLVVGINSDESVKRIKGERRPIMDQRKRTFVLSAVDFVDYIVIFEEDTLLELIQDLRPDILVKGSDYTLDEVAGKDIVESYGGKVEIISTGERFSTTDLIQRIINNCKGKKDVDYLRMFAIETQGQMKSLVETEYKWLQSYILVLPILLALLGPVGSLLKGYKHGPLSFLVYSVILSLFLIIITALICSKITKENGKYRDFGQQLVKMWTYFNLFDAGVYLNEPILTCHAKTYGKGPGSFDSKKMLWLLTVIASLIIVAIGVFCFRAEFMGNIRDVYYF